MALERLGRFRRGLTPARVIVLAFAGAILVGTLLLALPWAHQGERVTLLDALFELDNLVVVDRDEERIDLIADGFEIRGGHHLVVIGSNEGIEEFREFLSGRPRLPLGAGRARAPGEGLPRLQDTRWSGAR